MIFLYVFNRKMKFYSFFKGVFYPYAALGRTTLLLNGSSTKILLAAFFRFMQMLFSTAWALTFILPATSASTSSVMVFLGHAADSTSHRNRSSNRVIESVH